MNVHIAGGRVIDPASGLDVQQDVYVSEADVAAIGKAPPGFRAERTIEAKGLIICPGLVDMAARLREPGLEYRATLESEAAAAVAGGVTSLACPPDTDPPLDEPGLVEMLKYRARSLNLVHVYPIGALTQGLQGRKLTEMSQLADAGCVAFSQGDAPLPDPQMLLRSLQYASTLNCPVWLRPQEPSLASGGVAHDGEVATRLGLPAIPKLTETIAVSALVLLARETSARVHLCRLSSAESVEMVRQAKADGLRVSCDVSMNHLHLTDVDIGDFESNCNLIPPLRSRRDLEALRAGLADGTIDAICSDHTPVDDDDKQLPFAEAAAGATGLELLLPLTLKWAEESGVAMLEALACLTSVPANILGIAGGRLEAGRSADLCMFDPTKSWRVDPSRLRSQGHNTPFAGRQLAGKVLYTMVGGQIVYE
ncbi:MAG: dihydroorotase [Betaproteobacteria bacterium]|nr:MAG: dihydroorotase [Betaproteobacteria bacterium]